VEDVKNLHGYLQHCVGLGEVEPFREKEAAAKAQGKQAQKGIWDRLKSIAVTYAVAGMYALAMHDLLKRMQLHVLQHHSNAHRESRTTIAAVPDKAQVAFLKMSSVPPMVVAPLQPDKHVVHGFLAEQGLAALVSEVRSAVDRASYPLKTKCSRTEVAQMLLAIRRDVEADGGASGKFKQWMLPVEEEEEGAGVLAVLGREGGGGGELAPLTAKDLEGELRDLLDGPDLDVVLRDRLDQGFGHLEDRLAAKLGWEGVRADVLPKAMALLLAPFKEVAASLFNKDGAREETIAALNKPKSNRDFFTCIFWGAEDACEEEAGE